MLIHRLFGSQGRIEYEFASILQPLASFVFGQLCSAFLAKALHETVPVVARTRAPWLGGRRSRALRIFISAAAGGGGALALPARAPERAGSLRAIFGPAKDPRRAPPERVRRRD